MADKLVRIDSTVVRGEGSYVTFVKPKWKQLRGSLAAFNEAGGAENQVVASMAMMDVLVPQMIRDWNWTDDDGGPLLVPAKDPETWDNLEAPDVMFLINVAAPMVNFDRKN